MRADGRLWRLIAHGWIMKTSQIQVKRPAVAKNHRVNERSHTIHRESGEPQADINVVQLHGEIGSIPLLVEASGELQFRLVIRQVEGIRESVECVVTQPRMKRSGAALRVGTRVEVQGRICRKFWRGASGLGSKTYVEVTSLARR
jgi:hypothetical protein